MLVAFGRRIVVVAVSGRRQWRKRLADASVWEYCAFSGRIGVVSVSPCWQEKAASGGKRRECFFV